MTTNKDPIFLNSILTKNVSIDNADGTTPQLMFTAGADGGAITRLSAASTDGSAVILVITISDGALSVVVGEVSVPAGAGTNGTAPIKNLLDPAALLGLLQADETIVLGPAATLSVNAKVATSGVVTVIAQGGQYNV